MAIQTQRAPLWIEALVLGNEKFRARQLGEEFDELEYCQKMHDFYDQVCEDGFRVAGRDTQALEVEQLEERCEYYAKRYEELLKERDPELWEKTFKHPMGV